MPVFVTRDAPGAPPLTSRQVHSLASRLLRALGMAHCELSVLLCDDAQIRVLNKEHRRKDKPTDVLAFPQHETLKEGQAPPDGLLGDVVISVDTAAAQARARRRPLVAETAHLLAHGLLHLVGYDHLNDADEKRMNLETKRLLAALRPKAAASPASARPTRR